jgi:hypothetical protein
MKEKELRVLEDRLLEIRRQTKADIRRMQEANELEKEMLLGTLKRQIEKEMKLNVESGGATDIPYPDQEEKSKLENEAIELKAMQSEMEPLIAGMTEEHAKLQHANDDINSMFKKLNEYALKKVSDKKKLTDAQQKLANVLIPKIKRDISTGTRAFIVESKLKDIHRAYMYKLAEGVQASDMYDQLLNEEVTKTIQECESSLGNEVLDLNRSLDYLEADNAPCSYDESKHNLEHDWDTSQNLNSSSSLNTSHSNWESSATLDGSHCWNDSKNLDGSRQWNDSQKLDASCLWNASQNLDISTADLDWAVFDTWTGPENNA